MPPRRDPLDHRFDTIEAMVAYPRDMLQGIYLRFLRKLPALTSHHETREHMAVVAALKARPHLLWNYADAGRWDSAEKRKAAAMGAAPGHPDFIIHHRFRLSCAPAMSPEGDPLVREFSGLAIELKRVSFRYPGAEACAQRKDPYLHQQTEYLRRLRVEAGYIAEFAPGAWYAEALIEACFGPPRACFFG